MEDKDLKDAIKALDGIKAKDKSDEATLAEAKTFLEAIRKDQGFQERKGDSTKLRSLEARGIRILGKTRLHRLVTARGLHTIMMRDGLEDRIKAIRKYENAKMMACEYRIGGTGAYKIYIGIKGKTQPPIIVKAGNASAEVFGARLAKAAGLTVPEVHHMKGKAGHDFAMIENVQDFKGQTLKVRCFEGETAIRISSVGLLGKEIIQSRTSGKPKQAAKDFWDLMGTRDGRERFFSAWLDSHEFSRLALLCDRQHANAAVAFADAVGTARTDVCIISIDFDPIAFSILPGKEGRPGLDAFYQSLAFSTYCLLNEIARHRMVASKKQLSGKTLLGEMKRMLERRRGTVPAGYEQLKNRVIREINNPRNRGLRFGMKVGPRGTYGILTRQKAAYLSDAVEMIASPDERTRAIDAQIAGLRYFSKILR